MKKLLFILLSILLLPIYTYAYSVTLEWDYTQGEDPGVIFRLYRQMDCVESFEPLVDLDISMQTFTDDTGVDGVTYCYVTTAFDSVGQESDTSNIIEFPMP